LLLASVVAITFRAFDISADKIPIAGIQITYDRGAFEFLMVLLLGYFLLTFALYYYIDIKNFIRVHHQDETEAWRKERTYRLAHQFEREIDAQARFLPRDKGYWLGVTSTLDDHIRSRFEDFPLTLVLIYRLHKSPINVGSFVTIYRNTTRNGRPDIEIATKPTSEEEALKVEFVNQMQDRLRALPLRYFLSNMQTLPVLLAVRLAYILRNYGVDGVLPIGAAIVALLGLYDLIDLHSLAALAPHRG